MFNYPAPIERLVESLQLLPGIGPKTASRLAFYLLDAPAGQIQEVIASLEGVAQGIPRCPGCGFYAEEPGDINQVDAGLCSICADLSRNAKILCVVAQAKDVISFERTGEYRGLYHVLGGLISPMEGRGPDQLKVDELLKRIEASGFEEIILATDPTVSGQATALYLESLLKDFRGSISRLAMGLPVGSDFEVTDEVTLGRALSNRQRVI